MSGILLVLLALGAIAVAAYGHRLGIQPGLLILVVAAGVSFIPGIPRLELDPELILGVFVPPLLYVAALEFSFFSFMRNLRSILGLGVGLVLATTAATDYVTGWLLPAVGSGGIFVLAAIVGPPDTVTIAAHGDQIGLPRRVSAILTGESLVNDAAALTVFSVALASAVGTTTFIDNPVLLFLYSAAVGVLIGLTLGIGAHWVRTRLGDPTLETAIGLVLPFAAYLAAEELHASGVLAVVMAGFSVGLNSAFSGEGRGRSLNYRTRLTEGEVWPVIGSLLEAFVFAYTGLQLRFVLDEIRGSGEPLGRTLLAGVIVLLVVILVRLAWVVVVFGRSMAVLWMLRMKLERDPDAQQRLTEHDQRRADRGRPRRIPPKPLGWKESLLVSWTGMRGIVTLGAAGGIPLVTAAGHPFPHRTTIQFLAYFVVIGTLLVQGMTLPTLARRLRIDNAAEDRTAEAEIAKARAIAEATEGYDHQRDALTMAVAHRELDDEAARVVLTHIDRQQAAAEA